MQRPIKERIGKLREEIAGNEPPVLARWQKDSRRSIFLDASRNGEPGKITCEPVSSRSTDVHSWHQLTPGSLLALGAQLFGATPSAFSVSLCGESFDHGETLSPAVINSLPTLGARASEFVGHLAGSLDPAQGQQCDYNHRKRLLADVEFLS